MTVAVVVLLLAACGSGGEDGAAEETSTTTTAKPTTTTAPEPDGPLIAYQTNRGGEEGVWLVGRDGEGDRRIGADALEEQGLPDWFPDGQRIVLTTRGGPTEPLYVYDLDSETTTPLFDCSDPCLGEDEPAVSPDGTKVAFIRYLGPFVDDVPSDCGLWIGDVASGEVEQLTSNPGCDPRETSPRWSPDGTQLTYWLEQYSDAGEVTATAVFVMSADGTGVRQLTDWSINAGDPDWSPDGEWIVYSTHPLRNYPSGVSNLFRMHPDGSGVEPLTDYPDGLTRASQPRYSPDGTEILFTLVTSDRDLAVIPAEGGAVEPITDGGIHTHGVLQPTS